LARKIAIKRINSPVVRGDWDRISDEQILVVRLKMRYRSIYNYES
jgi:hypothetical protein